MSPRRAPLPRNKPPSVPPTTASSGAHRRKAQEAADMQRRFVLLGLLRWLAMSIALGMSLWVTSRDVRNTMPTIWILSAIVAATFASNAAYGFAMRRGVAPPAIIKSQLIVDFFTTSMLVYLTGGVQSPYVLLFALSIITGGAILYRRGALIITLVSMVAITLVSVAAWRVWLPLPMAVQMQPWEVSVGDFARNLSINLGALLGIGALAIIFGDQLERTSRSLESERKTFGDLQTLHHDIVQSLSSGLVTTDLEGTITSINNEALDILGYERSLAARESMATLLPGLREKLGTDPRLELRRADLHLPRGGVELVLGVSVSPLYDAQDTLIGRVINFQDLTELRRMEAHMSRAERLATVGQLAAGVAHEIRNPLAAISGSIELLRQGPQTSADDRSLMSIVVREIDRLNTLITELLDYANPRELNLSEFDVCALLDEVAQVARQDKSNGAVMINLVTPGPTILKGDSGKLRQVLWNLVRNACEASPAQNSIIDISARTRDDEAYITVADNGEGIAPERLPHIFDPFFTTKPTGTGLGLATCHSIITDHGGRIDVDSELGVGTRMTVVLPLANGLSVPALSARAYPRPRTPSLGGRSRPGLDVSGVIALPQAELERLQSGDKLPPASLGKVPAAAGLPERTMPSQSPPGLVARGSTADVGGADASSAGAASTTPVNRPAPGTSGIIASGGSGCEPGHSQ